MNEFTKLIKQEKISSKGLIKRSAIIIKENFGKFMASSLLYGAVLLVLSIVLAFITYWSLKSMIASVAFLPGGLIIIVAVFIASVILYFVGCQTMLGVYYTILGYSEKAYEKVTDEYVRKSFKLSIFISIIVVAVVAIFVYGSLNSRTFYGAGITYIVNNLLTTIFLVATIIMYKGVKLEYLLTEQTLSESMKKVFRLSTKNIRDVVRKTVVAMIFGWTFLGTILFITLSFFLDSIDANLTGLGTGFSAFSLNSVPALIGSIFFFVLMVFEMMIIGMFYNVFSTGYYLNLNYRAGNEITGLENDEQAQLNNEQEVQPLSTEVQPLLAEEVQPLSTEVQPLLAEEVQPVSTEVYALQIEVQEETNNPLQIEAQSNNSDSVSDIEAQSNDSDSVLDIKVVERETREQNETKLEKLEEVQLKVKDVVQNEQI